MAKKKTLYIFCFLNALIYSVLPVHSNAQNKKQSKEEFYKQIIIGLKVPSAKECSIDFLKLIFVIDDTGKLTKTDVIGSSKELKEAVLKFINNTDTAWITRGDKTYKEVLKLNPEWLLAFVQEKQLRNCIISLPIFILRYGEDGKLDESFNSLSNGISIFNTKNLSNEYYLNPITIEGHKVIR